MAVNDKGGVSCPECGSPEASRNGRTRHGSQNFKCKACGRQFVADPAGRISDEVKAIADRMIRDRVCTAKIMEYTGVSASWVYQRRREVPVD